MANKKVIMWFRQDLRLADNPALTAACQHGEVVPIYILDDANAGEHKMGGASRWWLHHSLASLNNSLANHLNLFKGDPKPLLTQLIDAYDIEAVYWNRCYEPWRIQRDTKLKQYLTEMGIEVHSSNGSLLWEPWENLKADGNPYRVFTPFYRRGCLESVPPSDPIPKPVESTFVKHPKSEPLSSLGLLPTIPWDKTMNAFWQIGEEAAHQRLADFLQQRVFDYKSDRDYPAVEGISRLSPHLHFGELSPHQIWSAVKTLKANEGTACFLSELGWREFSYSLLYHNPELSWKNVQPKFDAFPWRESSERLLAWQRGQTGVPIVDAGMRELWATGFMHNRVRMIAASFLVKNLMIDWRLGERWFWDCLVDADMASNSASWQWVAGCGADAAPYFRIFNPVTQAKKFDPDGDYIKQWVPELSNLAAKDLYAPWGAKPEKLHAAGIRLGIDYPRPLVDLKVSRSQALEAFQSLKGSDHEEP